MAGWVYIMTNANFGTLYTGVTADIAQRVSRHKAGTGSKFCKKWGLTRLVYAEPFDDIVDAIAREKQIKKWHRSWRLRLIREANPEWEDLYERING